MIRSEAIILSTFLITLFSSSAFSKDSPHNQYGELPVPDIAAGGKVLVFPLNPNRLLKTSELQEVERVLHEQLTKSGGKFVKAKIEDEQARFDYFLLTSTKATAYNGTQEAKKQYIADIAAKYSLAIIPSVFETLGEFEGKSLVWDGAKVTVMMVGGGSVYSEWSGNQRGLTIKLEVFDSQGNWLMTTQGGFSMPRYAVMSTGEFLRKEDLFERKKDKKYLSKGVNIAVKPFLTRVGLK